MDDEPEAFAWLENTGGDIHELGDAVTIGRSTSHEVTLTSKSVSRTHATVQRQADDSWLLVDLGSSNGTYLNGRRIHKPAPLKDRDRLQFGDQEFLFRDLRAIENPPPPGLSDEFASATLVQINTMLCWMLIVDLVNSTELSKDCAPDEWARKTNHWLNHCRRLIEERHGAINKFLGDGLFAYWRNTPSHREAPVCALRDLRAYQGGSELPYRIVLHFGLVTIGGTASLGEENLSGPEVSFVFRMEKICSEHGHSVLISEPARREIQDGLESERVVRHTVAGFEGARAFYTV